MPFDPGNPPPLSAVEQYKSKLSDLANLGTRLTAMTTYYVSLISAFLGVLAFKDPEHVKVVVASIKQPEAAYSMRSPRHRRCRRAQG